MNEAAERLAPSFGLGVLAPATSLLLVPLLIAASRIRSLPGRFLIAAPWIRYICGAYHVYMFKPLAAGLSGTALVSVPIVAVALLVLRARYVAVAVRLPIYLFIALVWLRGGVTGDIA